MSAGEKMQTQTLHECTSEQFVDYLQTHWRKSSDTDECMSDRGAAKLFALGQNSTLRKLCQRNPQTAFEDH